MSEFWGDLYDLHNHLLFGIDDGAKNAADCEDMLKDAAQNNIKLIVATPHIAPCTDMVKYKANLPVVVELAARYGIKVVPGGEYNGRYLPEITPDLTLGGLKQGAILIDFRMPAFSREFQLFADNILNAGHILLIAHPERTFPEFMYDEIERIAECGVIYQVTAGSLLGKYGSSAKRMAWKLLANGLAGIIASDAHDINSRPSYMREAFRAVERKFGRDAALTLQENARRIIEEPGARLEKIPIRNSLFNLWGLFS